ncbi:TetR family transcriptional regulator [Nocardiopsis sp. EMB25]|uniref:TetR/AcrR family transcriptional regulator n=1 Tax=Nocardiopsis sp. EMB25 TaxID=2835867 RepID=UPI0022836DA5|nr:TetR family transcriptional regulator [Nocardiopsis sp. EMB25]MCY9785307.1 TetR family transcriptional regulator [Nocardiopsis sp. EMB25]
MSNEPTGLRESKKQETRRLISDHATRLFMANGFEETTIADIAAAARVAKKTVTNYFARKEDMAFDRQEEFVRGLALLVALREEGESALASLRRGLLAGIRGHDPVIGFSGPEFARMVTDSPTLVARLRDLHDQREAALAEALAAETGTAPDDLAPRIAAAQLAAADRILFRRVQELTLQGWDDTRIAETVAASAERAFTLMEGSLGDYAVR